MRYTVTREDVRQLRYEAGEAGDAAMVDTCTRALRGDDTAWAECEAAIIDERIRASEDDDGRNR